jgi:hypothetical protein
MKVNKLPPKQPHQQHEQTYDLPQTQETEHSTGENRQTGNEDTLTEDTSMETSDSPTRDAAGIKMADTKGPSGHRHKTHDEIPETKERDMTPVTTNKMTALPKRTPNPLQPTMDSKQRPPRQPEAN